MGPGFTFSCLPLFTRTVSPSGGGAFSPDNISGLSLWLKADALSLSDTDPVASWTDSSGNGNHATQATGANRPLFRTAIQNGLPAVQFDDTNDALVTSLNVARSYTIILVASQPVNSTTRIINSVENNNLMSIRRGSNTVYLGSDVFSGTIGVNNVFAMMSMTVSTVDPTVLYFNGTDITGGSPPSANWGTVTFGASGLNAEPAHALLAEVLVYDTALSTPNRESVEAYLVDKWGITI